MKNALSAAIAFALMSTACSSASDDVSVEDVPSETVADQADQEAGRTSEPEVDETVEAESVAVADAVVRVVTTGTFVSPEFGQLDTVGGSGSAFIIDPSGLAVTNNHVVAGAASVEVFFDADDDPIPAAVVARSECSDLAVIDLAGDGYPALGWAPGEAEVGVEVRAAGYPQGDQRLTLTGGIVARVDDDGATPWASIPSLLRHDAELEPGNSGGPIVDAEGAVVGVNVAASSSGRFAIPAWVAQPIVAELTAGIDVDSIGLNAVAVLDEVTNESGVWVVSIEPGSPAATAGLQPGDVITRMKGIRVGKDATLADYCAVIRSTGDRELPIEVTRKDGYFAGSLRGPALVSVLAVTDDVVATATAPPPAAKQTPPPGTPYTAYETVTDTTGTISLDVPTEWADRHVDPVFFAGADRPAVAAGFDVDALDVAAGTTYDEAGIAAIVFGADIDIAEAFAAVTDNAPWMYDCVPLERTAFDDALYNGVVQGFMDCAGTSSTVFSIALQRAGEPNWMLLNIFAPTIADLDAAMRITTTFEFSGAVPGGRELDTTPAPDDERSEDQPTDGESNGDNAGTSGSDLPETVSSVDDMVAVVGPPPMAGDATEAGRNPGVVTVSYPTTASHEDLREWVDARMAALNCESPLVSETRDDTYWYYAVTCDYTQDPAGLFSYSMRIYSIDNDIEVEVGAIDWNAS